MDFLLDGLLRAFGLLFSGDPETWAAVSVTARSSAIALAGSLLIGAPLGFLLSVAHFRGRATARLAVDTLLALPTVLIGLLVYAFLTHRGPLGGMDLLFTIPGMAAGQALLGLPIVAALTAQAVEALDVRIRHTLLTLGANPRQVAMGLLWEARFAVMLAGLTAFGRIVSEVGIAMMVGGNIKWHTRTITTAIALETGKGQFAMGVALGLVLLALALVVNLGAAWLRRRMA
ncbi:ABC transporter permease [Desulfohalovibrio reitneri]|uniref:ABC transporter permease n=1 Tax=Desulfohalovibrio reitneri TaxID=1307759 RepID=UPI0004A75450|nr:ABC transporter permease [Desulfohalovibrio reitneri]